ncbi:hypothetical protein GCM10010504_10650 [Streptomyces griseus]|nr:hypothetical protein GCM10010504_10650 [Streptomyces griseus]
MLGRVAVPALLDRRDAQGGALGGAGPGRGGGRVVRGDQTHDRFQEQGAGDGEAERVPERSGNGSNLTVPERSGNPPGRTAADV